MRRSLLAGYLLLLALHHVHAARAVGDRQVEPEQTVAELVRRVGVEPAGGPPVRLAYVDEGPRVREALLLVHGSPGSSHDFDAVRARLPEHLRVLTVDLPGFGRSGRVLPDYSFRAHAAYLRELLDREGIDRAHVVGFSMGGGVALELARQDPSRIASIVLLAAIGVQEFELLGDYTINHALHGAQFAAIWAVHHLVPHFGVLSDFPLDLPFARNFYDSDQRPLRSLLETWEGPMLVLHGEHDFLVPVEAAREHLRIVPHAEGRIFGDGSHFLVWSHPEEIATSIAEWIGRVNARTAPVRADATPERVAVAQLGIEEIRDVRATGMTRWMLLVLIVLGTFVTEDLTCIGAGLLIAQGRLSAVDGFAAVFAGIYFGDLMLYGVGRVLGPAVLRSAPWKWLIDAEDLRRTGRWFERRGFWAILVTRMVPGTRLPTYVAAGVVRASFWRFASFFLLAVLLWTPLVVGFSALVGRSAIEHFEFYRRDSVWVFLALALFVLVCLRVVLPLVTWRGRRIALARWRRWQRWEFWPSWALYAPVALWIVRNARRYGGVLAATAVNPSMPAGGVVGESKGRILSAFGPEHPRIARFLPIPADLGASERCARVEAFLRANDLGLPVVLKPDAGQRGEGVVIVRERSILHELLHEQPIDLLVQEYVPGEEFGIFYVREDDERPGRILSLTEKRPLVVDGDGVHDLERLILLDPRALLLAEKHLRRHVDQLDRVPAPGERVVVTELGTHARGSVFVDAHDLVTPELEASIDRLARRAPGFRFGRFDVRVPSRAMLARGEQYKVLELNGLTSEATHMYDARYRFVDAVAILRMQWEIAYRIGADQIARGHRTSSWREILHAWWQHRRSSRFHAADRLRLNGGEEPR